MDAFNALTNSSRSRRAPIVPIRAVARPQMQPTPMSATPVAAAAAPPPVPKVEEKRTEPEKKTAPQPVKVPAPIMVPTPVEVVEEVVIEAVGEATPTAESPISCRADEADEPKEAAVNVSTCETTSNDDDKASESTTSCSAKADELVLPKEQLVKEVAAPKPAAAPAAVSKAEVAPPPVAPAPTPAVRADVPRFCKNCPGPKVPHRCYKSTALSFMEQMKALQIKPMSRSRV